MQTIVNLVAAGLGIAWVPDSVREFRRAGVTYRQLASHRVPGCETSLVWPVAAQGNPALERILSFARQQLRAK